MDIFSYDRIMIVGNNGSGKSYLAKQLANITELPLTHLDTEFWKPDWVMTPRDEWIGIQKELVAGETWIIDGNHTSTMEIRIKACDLIIFLDINRVQCLISVVKRMGKKRDDMPKYIDEKFDLGFLKLCKGLWTFSKNRKVSIIDLQHKYPGKDFLTIKSRREVSRLLDNLRKGNR